MTKPNEPRRPQLSVPVDPDFQVAIGRTIDSTATFTFRSIQYEHQRQVAQQFDKSTQAAIQSKTEDLLSLVQTGGGGTPQSRAIASEIHSLQDERVRNPVLAEPQEVADLRTKQLNQQILAAGASYRVTQVLKGQSPYQGAVDQASQKYGLNPTIFARQINQESGFDPNAVSRAGAVGIAQFMPATAARYGVNPRDPNSSIEGAGHYMADLEKQFGNNTGLALAGYNWGEGNVAAWMAAGANPNAMPTETRNYIQAITGQSIEHWLAGQHPTADQITALGVPAPAQGNVRRALTATQGYLEDQSVAPEQRLMNYKAGIGAIKDFQDGNVRAAKLAADQQKATDNAFESSVIADSATAQPKITEYDVKTDPNITAESKMRMLGWLKRDGMPEPMARTSQGTSMDLFRRMNLPSDDSERLTDASPIRDAYVKGTLSRTDEDWLEKRFQESRTPDGERLTKLQDKVVTAAGLDKSTMFNIDGEGRMRAYSYNQFVQSEVDRYRKEGNNPYDLFNPGNKAFIGAPGVVNMFNAPLADQVRATAGRMNAAVPTGDEATAAQRFLHPNGPAPSPQRKAGESIADYLSRTGK
jgi:soluble lytic murein transglycosylase-like protein